jgi:hypothetical protein
MEPLAVLARRHPVLVEGMGGAREPAPFLLDRAEDELALLFGEIGTAADQDGGEDESSPLQGLTCGTGNAE